MAAPDPLAVRMYENTIANQQKTAKDALNHLRRALNSMEVDNPVSALGTARNAAGTLAELTAALSALKVANDLRFLTEEA
jgi:hypothetical protein